MLRGSLLLEYWVPALARKPHDIDFVALDDETYERAAGILRSACDIDLNDGFRFRRDIHETDLFDYTESPGTRFEIGYTMTDDNGTGWVQVDVATGEPFAPGPERFVVTNPFHSHLSTEITGCTPATALAWKLCWILTDLAEGTLELKDPQDAELLAGECPIDGESLHLALTVAFERADIPLGRLFDVCDPEALIELYPYSHLRNEFDRSFRELAATLPQLLAGSAQLPTPEELPFLQEIRRNPGDISAKLIYADWLEEQGDLRGDFLRLHCRRDDSDPSSESRQRYQELREKMDQEWVRVACGSV